MPHLHDASLGGHPRTGIRLHFVGISHCIRPNLTQSQPTQTCIHTPPVEARLWYLKNSQQYYWRRQYMVAKPSARDPIWDRNAPGPPDSANKRAMVFQLVRAWFEIWMPSALRCSRSQLRNRRTPHSIGASLFVSPTPLIHSKDHFDRGKFQPHHPRTLTRWFTSIFSEFRIEMTCFICNLSWPCSVLDREVNWAEK